MSDDLRAARLARLRAALSDAPFDALLATTPETVSYATGYRSVSGALFRAHRLAALVTAEAVILVAPAADAGPAVDAGLAPDRIVPFGRFYFESAHNSPLSDYADRHAGLPEAVTAALHRRETRVERIGVEGEGADGALFAAVDAAVGEERRVDASAWVQALRGAKLPPEVDRLRTAARLAEQGVEHALAQARPGSTERDLATVVARTMVEGGAEARFVVVTAGERSALADAFPTDNAWKPGQLLRFDVGCTYDGYWSDMARTAVLGEPDPLQAARYDALLAGQDAQLTAARAGVSAAALFDVAVATVEERGLAPYRRHHCGHGIGLAVYEQPIVAPGSDVPVAPRATLCLETPYYELGWGGMMVEDTVVVTENGYEPLTTTDRGLRVVPL